MSSWSRRLFLLISGLLAVIGIYAACSGKKKPFQLQGIAMTVPYHIIIGNGEASEDTAKAVVINTFEEIDAVFNKWNRHSELSRLNQWNSTEPFICSPELFSMLLECEKFFTISQGLFDPTVEPLEQVWIPALEKGKIPQQEDIDAIRPALGWEKIRLREGRCVKGHPKMALDLGGIAKGHAVDLLVERLAKVGFHSVYVEWGGEIRTHGPHPDGRLWKIGIRHPQHVDKILQVLETEGVALATSGDYLQYWTITINGETKHFFHVFDLKEGKPLEASRSSLASVTIQQESCLVADAIAKTFLFAANKEEASKIFERCILPSFPTARAWMFSHEEAGDGEVDYSSSSLSYTKTIGADIKQL